MGSRQILSGELWKAGLKANSAKLVSHGEKKCVHR